MSDPYNNTTSVSLQRQQTVKDFIEKLVTKYDLSLDEAEKFFEEENSLQGLATWSEIKDRVSFLQGRVLTVLEAAITDSKQLTAIKKLLRDQFRQSLKYLEADCNGVGAYLHGEASSEDND